MDFSVSLQQSSKKRTTASFQPVDKEIFDDFPPNVHICRHSSSCRPQSYVDASVQVFLTVRFHVCSFPSLGKERSLSFG